MLFVVVHIQRSSDRLKFMDKFGSASGKSEKGRDERRGDYYYHRYSLIFQSERAFSQASFIKYDDWNGYASALPRNCLAT